MKREYLLILIMAVMLALGLIVSVATFSSSTSNGRALANVSARLNLLETNKASATAKRFTSDDADALLRCLRIPYEERERCLMQVETTITARAK